MKNKHKKRPHDERPEETSEAKVLAHVATIDHAASVREIAHGMGLKHRGRRYLPRILQSLKRRGEIEEVREGRYQLARAKNESANARPHASAASGASATPRIDGKKAVKRAPDPALVPGRLVAHRDGYGFVVPDRPIPNVDGDLFIPPSGIHDAMHGDRVLARIEHRRPDGRAEARIVQITERVHPTVVGLFRYEVDGNYVLPYDTRMHAVLIPPGEEITASLRDTAEAKIQTAAARRRLRLPELDGAVVNAQITRYPKGGLAPMGRVIEILGRPGEIGVDVEIMIRKHHLPHDFPEDVVAEARRTPQQVSETALRGRRDFRDLPIVTIDGETARDFDDAVYVREHPDGGYELQVHIADVAHYVPRGSPLDREARLRGTSVYFPNRAVPMLPEELSNGICSLNPHVERLVMSVVMQFDETGRRRGAEFSAGVIRSAERMTYTNVNKVLEADPEAISRYASLAPEFRRMKDLALLLNARRVERGSIDFDLPEPVIEFDPQGRMLSIVRSERNIAHRLIEEFMLAANEAVAEYLERRGIASLHRVHEKPDPKRVLEFEELAHAFGYSLGVDDLAERRIAVRHGTVRAPARMKRGGENRGGGRMRPMTVALPASDEVDVQPQHYQRLTRKIAGKPEERILSYLMLRSLKQARYAADPLGHFALAAQEYTHFTSPIRRYPDLIVHRVLKWGLDNPDIVAQRAKIERSGKKTESVAMLGPYRRVELEEIASESSEAERRADGAERELMEWKTAQFMESHLGDEYEALIISVQKFGFFVELMDIFVEGLVSIDRIEEFTGLRCVFRERDHAIVAQGRQGTQQVYRLGDRVRVQAERIDPFRHRVEFALI
ncbi:MAG TPA: VacB/RNase II family 3'-5' exoribonuclease [Candidatus Aquilonibacter sp.]|nr:VacB/RNase II family 3'-5' exoribonuclease [Candidatus Aquilonibacter sp.]